MNDLINVFAPFIIALLITAVITPSWVTVCLRWKLFDQPDTRKHHITFTPSMGGIAIFAGIFISFFIFSGDYQFIKLKFILGATFLLFLTGFFDDLLNIPPQKKLVMQIIASLIVISGGTRITNLYGVLGIHEIPFWMQYPFTMLIILIFTNAFNFIDGIDGLATIIGIISSAIFGALFFIHGQIDFALLSICLTGALIGFLFYNYHPARIFMGDTGSLVIGFLIISFAINLLGLNNLSGQETIIISPAFIFAVLFIPIYDLIRVSVIRVLSGSSLLKPDRNHIHHMILNQRFGHRGTAFILAVFNIIIIVLQYSLSSFNVNGFIIISICIAVLIVNTFVMIQLAGLRDRIFGVPKERIEASNL